MSLDRGTGNDAVGGSARSGNLNDAILRIGCYSVSLADTQEDIRDAQELRALCFSTIGLDQDAFDLTCQHFLIRDNRDDRLVCCFRLLLLDPEAVAEKSYASQFYDLNLLSGFVGVIAELGRFCVHPDVAETDVIRAAWGGLTNFVDAYDVRLLMGCSSFAGTDPNLYSDSFAHLNAQHLAPERWRPGRKAPEICPLQRNATQIVDLRLALSQMPTLLRSYLSMGGWVSDHAVVDRDLNTLHVFTGVEVAAIPPARKRLLRAIAG